jgi:hypothetical protein
MEATSKAVPNKIDTKKLSRDLGRAPFEELDFTNNHAKCPFHNGDSNSSLAIKQGDDGIWRVTCFSDCKQTWDPIAYVMKKRNVPFLDAVRILGGRQSDSEPLKPVEPTVKSHPKAMTLAEWATFGRELTPDDITRFAKSRKDKTAGFETFKSLGCRVKDDYLAFPHFQSVYDPRSGEANAEFYTLKLRHLDRKEFDQQFTVSQKSFFNLDTVSPIQDVFVVEGEPDVAVMEEAGFRAVSVVSGSQKKFSKEALRTLNFAARTFLVGDQGEDDPGQGCMDALQRREELDPAKTFRVRFSDAHDVSELARKTGDGFAAKIEELRDENLEPWVAKNLPTISQVSTEPVKWIVDRFLPYGCLTMLVGSQGSMKTMMAMAATQAISTAYPWKKFLGRDILRGGVPVLYVDRENPESEIGLRARSMGILANQNFIYWGDSHNGEATPELDDPRLMEFARRKNGFFVFDSLQDWYGDENENDNSAMVKLIGKFRKLARAGAGVLLLHHKNASGERARGGTGIVALTDMAIKSTKSADDQNVIELREERFRMCERWEIDVRAHFDAGEFHGHEKHYQFEVLRDQRVSDVMREEKASRRQEDEEDKKAVLEVIGKFSSNAPSTLAAKINMDRKKFERIASMQGWDYDREKKSWVGSQEIVEEDLVV